MGGKVSKEYKHLAPRYPPECRAEDPMDERLMCSFTQDRWMCLEHKKIPCPKLNRLDKRWFGNTIKMKSEDLPKGLLGQKVTTSRKGTRGVSNFRDVPTKICYVKSKLCPAGEFTYRNQIGVEKRSYTKKKNKYNKIGAYTPGFALEQSPYQVEQEAAPQEATQFVVEPDVVYNDEYTKYQQRSPPFNPAYSDRQQVVVAGVDYDYAQFMALFVSIAAIICLFCMICGCIVSFSRKCKSKWSEQEDGRYVDDSTYI